MKAVILAGGKGTRLKPYTTTLPKPLMPVGDQAILEIVIAQLKAAGITEITLAVGHLAELIMAYFGDGKKHGVKITYYREESPLGTAGPLANITGLNESFLVMNGDILTTLSYKKLIDEHKKSGAAVTVSVNRREVNIDYGVISTNNKGDITAYTEKPKLQYDVSMGINVVHPRALAYLKKGQRFDFPDFIRLLLAKGEQVKVYESKDYWLDIGRPDDYVKAQEEFTAEKFLP
ncbi:MAG: sugar phosphate nucleotidyltransferase [Nanoarchaeota archaeon]|nr:sugar phosphate nucleotidyltransferase [Nanoarchaeota archaeon]